MSSWVIINFTMGYSKWCKHFYIYLIKTQPLFAVHHFLFPTALHITLLCLFLLLIIIFDVIVVTVTWQLDGSLGHIVVANLDNFGPNNIDGL